LQNKKVKEESPQEKEIIFYENYNAGKLRFSLCFKDSPAKEQSADFDSDDFKKGAAVFTILRTVAP